MNNLSNIPLVDLASQSRALKQDVLAAIADVIDSAHYILGKEVELFEEEFAAYCGARHGIGVANGTDALHLALRALEIGPGDEVITAGNSFVASALGIVYAGATPVLVDVDPEDYTLDIDALRAAITPRTKAIIPVHLYGQTARMDPIRELAERHGLKIVEDAAQAHGAEYRGRRAGTLGDVACFSFYPGKNLGAFGDGGALVTNDEALAQRLKVIRNYGQRVKNEHALLGFNSRLDTLQAAILLVKLRYLDAWTESRRAVAVRYRELLAGQTELVLPRERGDGKHVYHLFVVQHPRRDALLEHLRRADVSCGIHYPHPLQRAEPLRGARTVPDGLPVCCRLAERILSLPMYPELSAEQLERVCDAIGSFGREGESADLSRMSAERIAI